MTRTTDHPAPVPLPVTPRGARRELKSLLDDYEWPGDVDAVMLAVHEAMINAAHHGGGIVRVEACLDHDALAILVCDRGPGFVFPASSRAGTSPADPLAEGGRGLWLICQIASWAEAHREGTDFCLRLRFDPPPDRGSW